MKLIRKHTKRTKSEKAQMFPHKYNLVLVASATKQVLGVPAAHLMDLESRKIQESSSYTQILPHRHLHCLIQVVWQIIPLLWGPSAPVLVNSILLQAIDEALSSVSRQGSSHSSRHQGVVSSPGGTATDHHCHPSIRSWGTKGCVKYI